MNQRVFPSSCDYVEGLSHDTAEQLPDPWRQGSLVTAERLRFDFNLHRGLTSAEVARVEALVNGWVADDVALTTREMPLAEAKAAGVHFPSAAHAPLREAVLEPGCVTPAESCVQQEPASHTHAARPAKGAT